MKLISWRTRVSIPVPSECESDALPLELVPHENLNQELRNFSQYKTINT